MFLHFINNFSIFHRNCSRHRRRRRQPISSLITPHPRMSRTICELKSICILLWLRRNSTKTSYFFIEWRYILLMTLCHPSNSHIDIVCFQLVYFCLNVTMREIYKYVCCKSHSFIISGCTVVFLNLYVVYLQLLDGFYR